MKKIWVLSLILLLALGGLGVSYASWSQNLTMNGTMVTATPPTALGDSTLEITNGSRSAGWIEAWDKFTTTVPFQITSFVLYQSTAGGTGNMHVGLYTDSGNNSPNSLVSGSDSGSLSVSSASGWVTYNCNPFNLSPGTYWIVYTFDTAHSNWNKRNTTGTHVYKNLGSYAALPSSWPSGSTSETNGPTSMYFVGN